MNRVMWKKKRWKSARSVEKAKKPTLRFSPTAWAKLLYLRDYGESEVGGFGICETDDLLRIDDVRLIGQTSSWASVAFDDESVANFFDEQVDGGLRPEQFGRIWVHTHPGNCPRPSGTDEETFARVFGRSDWAIMFILAKGGRSYARLRFNTGPRADLVIPVDVDYSSEFAGTDMAGWEKEYLSNVSLEPLIRPGTGLIKPKSHFDEPIDEWRESWNDYVGDDDDYVKGLLS